MNSEASEIIVNPELTVRQQDLVRGATRLLDREGLDGFTMRSLASEIGLSPMAAYKHFENQRDLQLELWSSCMLTLHRVTVDALKKLDADVDPSERFMTQCRVFLGWATLYPNRFELVFNHPFIREVRKEPSNLSVRYLLWEMAQRHIIDAQASGAFRTDQPAVTLATVTHSILQGMAYNLVSERVKVTSKMEQEEAINTALMFLRECMSGTRGAPA
jgi:AcrR family transcriptional regulator